MAVAWLSKEDDRRPQFREQNDQILALAEHLNPAERALIESVYDRGIPVAELARAAGVPASRLQNRVRTIMRHLTDPVFRYVVANFEHWQSPTRDIAQAIILHRRTQRDTAASLNVTVHRVRQEIARIRHIAEHQWQSPSRYIAPSPQHHRSRRTA